MRTGNDGTDFSFQAMRGQWTGWNLDQLMFAFRCEAIACINAELLLVGHPRTNFSEI